MYCCMFLFCVAWTGSTQEASGRGPSVREAGGHARGGIPCQHELPLHDLQRQRGRHRKGRDGERCKEAFCVCVWVDTILEMERGVMCVG